MAEAGNNVLSQSVSRWPVVAGTLVVYAIDWMSKMIVMSRLQLGESIPLIPGVFHLTRTANTGAAFSLFYQHSDYLTIVAALLFVAFLTWALTCKTLSRVEQVGFMLVLGGTLGNLFDRLRYGAVVDFIDVRAIHYPIFNIADTCIFIGMALLVGVYVTNIRNASHS